MGMEESGVDQSPEQFLEEMRSEEQNVEPKEETSKEETSKAEEAVGYTFKTDDDLLAHKLKYQASGKEIEEDLGTILKRASFGYNSAQVNAEAKQMKEAAEKAMQEATALREKWGRFDEYAQQNPEWHDHWSRAWDNRTLNPNEVGFDPAEQANVEARVEQLLQEKLKPFQEKFQSIEEQEQQKRFEQEDQQLSQEVDRVRSQYKNIDFDHPDPETGESLELQVLRYQANEGIKSFDSAFKAFYHDKLVKMEVERAEQAKLEAERDKRKQGIVSERSGSNGPINSVNHKGKNYDQLTDMAMKEFGLGD